MKAVAREVLDKLPDVLKSPPALRVRLLDIDIYIYFHKYTHCFVASRGFDTVIGR